MDKKVAGWVSVLIPPQAPSSRGEPPLMAGPPARLPSRVQGRFHSTVSSTVLVLKEAGTEMNACGPQG